MGGGWLVGLGVLDFEIWVAIALFSQRFVPFFAVSSRLLGSKMVVSGPITPGQVCNDPNLNVVVEILG